MNDKCCVTCKNSYTYQYEDGSESMTECRRTGALVNKEFSCEMYDRRENIKDSGDRTTFETGAVRDMHEGKGRMDLLPWEALIEVSKHCEEGAKKYGERNCEKGIPIHSLIDSAFRHLAKYTIGMDDEPHLRAAAWNILFALYMEQVRPEMQDIPARMHPQTAPRRTVTERVLDKS